MAKRKQPESPNDTAAAAEQKVRARQVDHVQPILMMNLLRAFYWFDEALQDQFAALGWPRNSRAQSMAMINVEFGVRRSSDIARNLGVTRQAMSQVIKDLNARGMIQILPDPSDRRAQIIQLNPELGQETGDIFRSALEAIEAELSRLSELGGSSPSIKRWHRIGGSHPYLIPKPAPANVRGRCAHCAEP